MDAGMPMLESPDGLTNEKWLWITLYYKRVNFYNNPHANRDFDQWLFAYLVLWYLNKDVLPTIYRYKHSH